MQFFESDTFCKHRKATFIFNPIQLYPINMSKFLLQLDPAEKVQFASADLGTSPVSVTLKLKNPEKERLAYKVKCTSNALFRIRPPVGAVDAGASADVQLTFQTTKDPVPDSGKHYFAVYQLVYFLSF